MQKLKGNAVLFATIGLLLTASILMLSQYTQTQSNTKATNQDDLSVTQNTVNMAAQRAMLDAESWLKSQNPRPQISSAGGGLYTYNGTGNTSNYTTWSDNQWASNTHAPHGINFTSCNGIANNNLKCYWIIEETSCATTGSPATANYTAVGYASYKGIKAYRSKSISLTNNAMSPGPSIFLRPAISQLSLNTLCPVQMTFDEVNNPWVPTDWGLGKGLASSRGQAFTTAPATTTFTVNAGVPAGETATLTELGLAMCKESASGVSFPLQITTRTGTTVNYNGTQTLSGSVSSCFTETCLRQESGADWPFGFAGAELRYFTLPTPVTIRQGDTVSLVITPCPGCSIGCASANRAFQPYSCGNYGEYGHGTMLLKTFSGSTESISTNTLSPSSVGQMCRNNNANPYSAVEWNRDIMYAGVSSNPLYVAKGRLMTLSCP